MGCEVDHIYACYEIQVINKLDLGLLAWNLWCDFRGKQVTEWFYKCISPRFSLKWEKPRY